MRRFSKIAFSSALVLMMLTPFFADAAPKKKCAIENNQVFYLMLSIDRTVSAMQQDLLNYANDNELKSGMNNVLNALNVMHQDFGTRAVKHDDVYYDDELNALKKAASNYYKLAYDRMHSQHIQNAYELSWLLQESQKSLDNQCRNSGKKNSNWKTEWDKRPKYPVDNNRKPGNNVYTTNNVYHPNSGHHPNNGYNPSNNRYYPNAEHQHDRPMPPPQVVITPVDDKLFLTIRKQLRATNFITDLNTMLESIAPYNHFTMEQLRTLITDQRTDDKRLAVMKHVFPNVIDKNNWFTLYELFTFQTSKNEVKSIAESNL